MSASPPPPGVQLEPLAFTLVGAITRLRRALLRSRHAVLRTDELSPARLELLRLVAYQPGIGIGDAARQLGAVPTTVSSLIAGLLDDQLLARTSHPGERRTAILNVTERGAALLNTWDEPSNQALTTAINTLGPAQQARLGAALPVIDQCTIALHRAPGVRRTPPVRSTAAPATAPE